MSNGNTGVFVTTAADAIGPGGAERRDCKSKGMVGSGLSVVSKSEARNGYKSIQKGLQECSRLGSTTNRSLLALLARMQGCRVGHY